MKKLFLIPLFIGLILSSCDEEEGCEKTEASSVNRSIEAKVIVTDQYGNNIGNYPVEIGFQKRWCDGSWAILVSNSGTTGNFSILDGEFTAYSPTYELNNEDDYVLVKYVIGDGSAMQEYSERATYADFTSSGILYKSHAFTVIQ